jgi:hypothetical protein
MLAKRLARRGVVLSAGGALAALAQDVASAAAPASVVSHTISAASLVAAAGQAAGVMSADAAALTEGVLKAMSMSKLKVAVAVVLVLGFFVAAGATALACRTTPAAQGDGPPPVAGDKPAAAERLVKAPAPRRKEPKQAKAGFTAWGKEVDGLQMGLALVPQDAHTFRQGETMKLAVKLRNVGKAEVTITYGVLRDSAPQVTTDTGGRVSVYLPPPSDNYAAPTKRVIKAGETITLYNPEVAVESEVRARLEGLMRVDAPTIGVEAGKYEIAFGGMIRSHPKLATGAVGFEVKEPAKPAAPVKDDVAWGEEAGGLRAGLGLKAGAKRVYRHGETVTLVVRVRNVGKEAVKFEHVKQFLDENPHAVTGDDGKAIRQAGLSVLGAWHVPVQVTLEPGKEIELGSRIHGAGGRRYELWPVGGDGRKRTTEEWPLFVGTGKVSLQCERVFGSSSIGPVKIDPALSKLATGKLELEVRPADTGKD